MKFAVKRYWQLCDEVHVDADSIDDAIERAHKMPLNEFQGDFVLGSLNSDPHVDVEQLMAKGRS